jgi:hypothetical protein
MGVDISVGEEPDKMKCPVVFRLFYKVFPEIGLEDSAVLDRAVNQFGALRKNTSRAEGIVAHFAVAHVVVRGKPYGGAVGLESGKKLAFKKVVKTRRMGFEYAVSFVVFTDADPVHDDQEKRPFSGREVSEFFK